MDVGGRTKSGTRVERGRGEGNLNCFRKRIGKIFLHPLTPALSLRERGSKEETVLGRGGSKEFGCFEGERTV
jgi:hypothetical protein